MSAKPFRRDVVPMKSGRSRLAFFPGCSLEGTGREYGESTLAVLKALGREADRKSTRLNSSHIPLSRMPASA